MGKFKYLIFPEQTYQVTVDDWDLKPYTFEVTGEDIMTALRRDALLQRAIREDWTENAIE
jgi:hypothetical protein